MIPVVLDTNVIVSALLHPDSLSGRILDLVFIGELMPVFDDRIIAEYREVLLRSRFGFPRQDVITLLDSFQAIGLAITAPPLGIDLPDPDDRPFVEVAVTGQATLITGNQRHYPTEVVNALSLPVTAPADFIRVWETGRG